MSVGEFTKKIYHPNYVKIGLAGLILRGTVADFFHILFGQVQIIDSVIDIVAIALFIVGLFEVFKVHGSFIIKSFLIFLLIWLFSYYNYPNNRQYIAEEYLQFFVYSLPFMWFGFYLIKSEQFIDLIVPIAKAKLFLALIVQIAILLKLSPDIFQGDYQTASYSLIFGLTVLYYKSTKDKRISDILLSVVGTVVLFLVGSRSIFISVLFYWGIYFIISFKKSRRLFIYVLLALFLGWFGLDFIINRLSVASEASGFSTHLSDALTDNAVFEDEARTLLYAGFVSFIIDSPFGYGVMADRYLSYSSGLFHKPIYPHNIFLELGIDFGYILGLAIIIYLLYIIIRGLYKQTTIMQMTVLILLSSSFIKLLFASTFWGDQLFFLLLGCLLATPRKSTNISIVKNNLKYEKNRDPNLSQKQ